MVVDVAFVSDLVGVVVMIVVVIEGSFGVMVETAVVVVVFPALLPCARLKPPVPVRTISCLLNIHNLELSTYSAHHSIYKSPRSTFQ